VEEENEDPEWAIDNHPANKILQKFDEEFGFWVNGLERAILIAQGGCPYQADDFSALDWQAMAILKQWRESKQNVQG